MWEQKQPFDLAKMGSQSGYCLKNVRLAFGIPPLYHDAKEAMLANKDAGTLHDISTLPKNVAVPVFVDTSSINEHVEVADHGTFYSDAKKVSDPMNQKFFGWGETLNGVRVVEFVPVPEPTPTPTPTPSGLELGDKVTLKNWVDANGTPLKKTRDFYYVSEIWPDTQVVLRADSMDGPVYARVWATNLTKVDGAPAPSTDFAVGDKVTLVNWVDYNGTPLRKTRDFYYIYQINGDRVVLTADSPRGTIYAAVNKNNLRKV